MKNFHLSGIKTVFCVAVLATAFLVSCDKDDPKPVKLSLSETKIEVAEGATSKTVNIKGGIPPYKVESSSKDIATVADTKKDFTVKGVKKGTATVTVKDKDGKSVTLSVTVKEKGVK